MNDVDIKYLISFLLVNKILNSSLDSEKLNLYAYSTHKCLYIKRIFMKIDIFIS